MKQVTSRIILLLACITLVSSCDSKDDSLKKADPIDRDLKLTRDDFRDMRDVESFKDPKVTANVGNVVEPPIPDLAEILAAPPKPKLGETQLVSLAVTDDVPLKDVLIEVARLAKVDIDVDASITGGVALRANERPFNEVIERISDMAGLRYSMKNGVLRVERDTPYIEIYSLDLLNSDRSSSGSISVGGVGSSSSSSSSSSSGSSGSSGGSGSNSSITAKADGDFWSKFETSVGQILAYSPAQRTSATTISTQPPPASQPEAQNGGVRPVQATGVSPVAQPSANTTIPAGQSGTFFVVNRQASTMTVSATAKQHDMIKKFITKIVDNTSAQVLIEAKIVEVNLRDEYQSGIDWNRLGGTGFNLSGDLSKAAKPSNDNDVPTLTILKNNMLRNSGLDLSAAVKLLDEFGTTRALSSPRLNAVNNQQAVLSFVEDIVYFVVTLTSTPTTTSGTTTTQGTVTATSERQTESVGIILNLLPSINKDTDEITLNVRPTLKRFVKFVDDPGFKVNLAIALQDIDPDSDVAKSLASTVSQVPQIEVREMDSIVKVKSGQTLVIGGLLEDKVINTDAGVPYASEVPVLGNLFKSVNKENNKKELVIFIRATIVGSSGSAHPYDKQIYEKFIQDPRPLKL